MPIKNLPEPNDPASLRARAHLQLERGVASHDVATSATSAHRVLLDLASSSDTAADALALLHELQVHQVELTLQAEELRAASAEMECALTRQCQLYDHAPVALMTMDTETRLIELNLTAAHLLGQAREALLGQRLDGLLVAHSAAALRDLLARMPTLGTNMAGAELTLAAGPPPNLTLHAQARVDPAGNGFLLALTNISPPLP